MRPIVIYNDTILNLFSWFFRVGGIAIFPFVIIRKNKKDNIRGKITINHETIHFWQCIELLVIGFYVLYLLFFLFNLIKYRDLKLAYVNIPFEKEAYSKELDFDYISKRKMYSWMS